MYYLGKKQQYSFVEKLQQYIKFVGYYSTLSEINVLHSKRSRTSRNLPIHQQHKRRLQNCWDRSPKAYLDRLVVGSFMTITSAMSPNLAKYSLRLSEIRINDSSVFERYLLPPINNMYHMRTLHYMFSRLQENPHSEDSTLVHSKFKNIRYRTVNRTLNSLL